MKQVRLRGGFSAAHLYNNPSQTADWNRENFGLCYSTHGHGHNYQLEIILPAEKVSFDSAGVFFKKLIDLVDHKHFNFHFENFKSGNRIPTSEELAVFFASQWKILTGAAPLQVKVFESPDLWALWVKS